ncbi:MAG: hypothetical protein KAY37_10940 [Phycisphaerae bacterium]|nr:hypothetical protein [Phycisphaerae bacterium]
MRASLVEMVLAIALTGIIFTAAIVPLIQAMVAFQEAELDLQTQTRQATATVRAEQLSAAIWRDADPPPNTALLQTARAKQLKVGDWELRAKAGRLVQKRKKGARSTLAEPVKAFSFQYCLNDGKWKSSASSGQLDQVLAIRCNWTDPASGLPFGGLVLAPDRAFSAGLIELPRPDTSKKYRRKDYERSLTLSLGSWK